MSFQHDFTSMPDRHFLSSRPVFEDLDAPQCVRAVRLHALWRDLKPADDLPGRDDFSFERLRDARLIRSIFIIEPANGGTDWRYRLVGSDLTRFFQTDVTNSLFSRTFDKREADACIACCNQAARSRTPLFQRGRIYSYGNPCRLETMSLPIWSRDRSEVWLLGATFTEV